MIMRTQKLAVVSGKGLSILSVKDKECVTYLNDESSVHEAVFDPSGRYICWCSNIGTFLLNLSSKNKVVLSSANKFRRISFSPKGNFVSVFSLNYGNNTDDNVSCFKTSDGELLHTFKYSNSGPWAPQWSADESICIRVHKSEVHFHSTENMGSFNGKIVLKGLESASLTTCNNKILVAVYVQGAQGMPHMVKIYQYPNLTESINNRSFFKANDVYLHWSPTGKALLFLVHTENTKTNYYGENSLYFMSSEMSGETAVVEMPKAETSVHGVDWLPVTGDKFIVTYGNPVATAVYNSKCQMLYHLDAPNRNVCKFSHCGNALAMMGAGSVRSSVQLWNFGTKKVFGELDIEDANRIAWSGDDRYFVSATVSPALRVNNGLIIWDSEGHLVADKATCSTLLGAPSEVYSCLWQPDPASVAAPGGGHTHCKQRKSMFYFDSKCQRYREKPATTANSTYIPPHRRGLGDANTPNGAAIVTTGPSLRITEVKPVTTTTTATTTVPGQTKSAARRKRNKAKNNNNCAATAPEL